MTEESKAKAKARVELLYRTKWLPTYLMFIALYPFGLEDLPGEIWAWISGYEGLYQISNFGRVKSFPKRNFHGTIILKPVIQKGGYLQVLLCKGGNERYFRVHRLVAQAFIPNPNNLPEVNHKFGNKFDNYVENLEWSTKSANIQHAFEMGLNPKGEAHHGAKLTDEQREEARRIVIKGDRKFGVSALARKYGVHTATLYNVIYGRKPWKRKKKD